MRYVYSMLQQDKHDIMVLPLVAALWFAHDGAISRVLTGVRLFLRNY